MSVPGGQVIIQGTPGTVVITETDTDVIQVITPGPQGARGSQGIPGPSFNIAISGNTAGATSILSNGTAVLFGAANITLSQSGQSISIIGDAGGGGGGGGIALSAAGSSVSSGTVTLTNSNNVSFGMVGSVVTASASFAQSTQTQASGAIAGTGTSITGNASITLNSQGLQFNGSALAGTSTGATNISLTLNSAGLAISAAAPVGAAQSLGVSTGGNTLGNTGTYSGQAIFVGGNNITLSVGTAAGGAQTITISGANAGGAQTGISGLQVSNTTYTSGTVTFQNANGISFGSSGANGISASYTVPTQTNQTVGVYASSQTVGQSSSSTVDARSFTHVGQGIISIGVSAGSLLFSATTAAQTNQTLGIYASSQTTAQSSSSTVDARSLTVVGAGIISAGMSGGSLVISATTAGGGGLTTAGLYALGNTTQNSSTTLALTALSFNALGAMTMGYSNSSIQVSAPNTSSLSATGNASLAINASTISIGANAAAVSIGGNSTSAGAGYSNISSGTVLLAGGNNITLSQNGASITISGANVGGAQTGISGLQVSNTTYTSGTVTFQNANGISFGSSGANGISASYTVPVQTNQTIGVYASSQTVGQSSSSTLDARSFTHVGQGIVSVGLSAGSLLISATTAAQTNQTLGLYASSQTTAQSSSSTVDARSLTIVGQGNISVGLSAGSFIISQTGGGGGLTQASLYAVSNTTQSSSGTQALSALSFAGAGNVSVGVTGGTVVVSGATAAGLTTGGLYALGNTTQNSSTTLALTAMSFNGLGAMTVGFSNSSIQLSAPATSSLVGVNGISISTNGSTISVSGQNYTQSWFAPEIYGNTMTSAHANGTLYLRPFELDGAMNLNQKIFQQSMASSNTTFSISASVSAGNASSGTATWGQSGTVLLFSRLNTNNTNASFGSIQTFNSTSYTLSAGYSLSVSWSTNASSASASWTTSAAVGYIANIGSDGAITTTASTQSGSSTFSSTSTNANSFSSSYVMSFPYGHLSGIRPLYLPHSSGSLAPNEYYIGLIQSTQTGTTNNGPLTRILVTNPGMLYFTASSNNYMEIGKSVAITTSNYRLGFGSYSSSGNTTTAIALSQVSIMASNASLYFALDGYTK